jgi:hemerythrin superfamily protein
MHMPGLSTLTRKMGLGTSSDDAVSMLTRDHREVDALFAAFEKAKSARDKQSIAKRFCQALTVHAAIEEQIFYPAASRALDDDFMIKEARVEHMHLKELVSEIEAMSPNDEMFEAKCHVLKEYVRHHVKEEEHEMFPRLRASDMDMDAVGEKMMLRRQQMMKKMRMNGHARNNGHARSNGHAKSTRSKSRTTRQMRAH